MTDRREPSLRAAARAQFRALAETQAPAAAGPELEPQPSLTAHVRDLYEAGVVPVREIAAIAGVSERTLYKYAQKGGWTRRNARRNPRGAGGRFVAAEDAGLPHASGLKALDPDGARRAAAACVRAGGLATQALAAAHARAAQAKAAKAAKAAQARLRTLDLLGRSLTDMLKALPADDSPCAARAFALAERLGCAMLACMTLLAAPPRLPGDGAASAPPAD